MRTRLDAGQADSSEKTPGTFSPSEILVPDAFFSLRYNRSSEIELHSGQSRYYIWTMQLEIVQEFHV
jgi:hypothetical protein